MNNYTHVNLYRVLVQTQLIKNDNSGEFVQNKSEEHIVETMEVYCKQNFLVFSKTIWNLIFKHQSADSRCSLIYIHI